MGWSHLAALVHAVALVLTSAAPTVPSHVLASSPANRPRQFGRPWSRDPDMPVRYHLAVLCNWKNDADFKNKQFSNGGLTQNVLMFVEMIETNTEWNVTRIHVGGEFNELAHNLYDLVVEVGASTTTEAKQRMVRSRRFVRVQYGHEYHLDQASFIHDAYTSVEGSKNLKYYSHPDRMWISPHFEHTSTYFEALYDTTVRVLPFIWSPRPTLRVQTADDFQQAVAAKRRNIVIIAPNTYTQKSALLPLLTVNQLWKKNPDAFDHVWVVSSSESFQRDFWKQQNNLLGQLEVYWGSTNKASFAPRATFEEILGMGPMVLLEHQDDCGLNYLTLEALHTRMPIVHNSPYFREQGFFYDADNVTASVEQLELALTEFGPRDYDAFIENFSPLNPEALAVYSDLVEDAIAGAPAQHREL